MKTNIKTNTITSDMRVGAKCPFFICSNSRNTAITCESVALGSNTVNFENSKEKTGYARKYCSSVSNYNHCPHAKALLEYKYGENIENPDIKTNQEQMYDLKQQVQVLNWLLAKL